MEEKETEFLLAQRASAACASPLQVITTDGVSGAKRDGGTRNSVRLAPAQERRENQGVRQEAQPTLPQTTFADNEVKVISRLGH